MSIISQIDTLHAYDDGDVITPGMGISIAAGKPFAQYWNPGTQSVSDATDWSIEGNRPTIYPQAYSSKEAAIIVPNSAGQQWYLNNLGSSEAGILEDGDVKASFAAMFQLATYTVNGHLYPALKIIGNLATVSDHTSKALYYQSTYQGKQFTCKVEIPIYETVGSMFEVVVDVVNEDGVNDNVIDTDSEYLLSTMYLLDAGQEVAGSDYKWQKLINGAWQDVVAQAERYALSSNCKSLTVYDWGLDGVENFRAVVTYNGNNYYKVVQLSDTHDPFYIDLGRSIPDTAIKRSETQVYTPKVYNRSDGSLQTGWAFTYTLTEQDGTVISTSNGASLSVPGTDVAEYGVINISITATK